MPNISLDRWSLTINGLTETAVELSWAELNVLPTTESHGDFHCVTGWTRLENVWRGLAVTDILTLAPPLPRATHVMVYAAHGYSTNLPLSDFGASGCLFATHHNGQPLATDHGGPVRLVVPHLYGWKSAKWVTGFEYLAADRPGYWERFGYHMRGDPWNEERHRPR